MRSAVSNNMATTIQKEPRDRQFNVGLTAHEHKVLLERATALGMRPVDYGRAQLFRERRSFTAREARNGPHLDPLFLAALSRLGNLLNQITRRLNVLEFPAPPSLEPLLQEIRDLITKGQAGGP
jgi:hypothetical protein